MVAWIVLAVGGSMATMFVSKSTLFTAGRYSGELAAGQGTVISSNETSSRSNGSTVVRATFVHEVGGVEYECESFHLGGLLEVDAQYDIEWPVGAPQNARIVGMKERPFDGLVGLVLLFPFAGLVVLAIGLIKNGRRVRLMRNGLSAWGLLTAKEPLNMQVNGQTVHELHFQFVDERGDQHTATDRTHDREYFDDQVARHVLFDRDTKRSCLVDLIPGRPEILDRHWQPPTLGDLLRVLALPVVAIVLIAVASSF